MGKLLCFLLAISLPLAAQTQLAPDQRRPNPKVAVLEAKVAALEALVSSLSLAEPVTTVFKLTASQASFSAGGIRGLTVIRNGLEQTEDEDYTLSGTVITFIGISVPVPDDIIKIKHWPDPVP